MITIKLPYKTSDQDRSFIDALQRQQSIIIRWAYNRFKEGIKQKDLKRFFESKSLQNIDLLGSWLISCGTRVGEYIFM